MARELPSATEAEASLLGTMMVYPNAARLAIEDGLEEDDFFSESNRRIFLAVRSLYDTGEKIDITTVNQYLEDAGQSGQTGGLPYLLRLTDAAVTSANTKTYVKMIHDKAIMRRMIMTAEEVVEEGYAGTTDIDEYLDSAEKNILNVSRSRKTGEFKNSGEVMEEVISQIRLMSDNKSDITGLKTGYTALDHTLHGLQPGDLDIIAARPAMGKTAFALNLALNCAMYNKDRAVAIFSLEMGAEQLGMRLLSARSGIPGDNLKTGRLSNEDWNKVSEAAADIKGAKIYIDDSSQIKVPEIFSKCRRLQSEQGLSLVLIDYIGLITGTGAHRNESRQQEVSDISRSLKGLARELNVPVVVLSQLSRTVESREDKRPILSDLRESGAIEQDADIVMMLYRDSYYNEETKQQAEKTGTEKLEVNIAKHRNGATRKIYLAFAGATNTIYNLQNDDGMEPPAE
jgi:replicative DNA helicase